jgi:hypothetical protein
MQRLVMGCYFLSFNLGSYNLIGNTDAYDSKSLSVVKIVILWLHAKADITPYSPFSG